MKMNQFCFFLIIMNHDCDCEVTTDPVIAQHIKQNENASKMIMIHKQT